MDDLDDYYEGLPSVEGERISVGQNVAATWPGDNIWYRGTVKAQKEDGWEIFFFDYGDSQVVREPYVRLLHRKFSYLPAQAIRAKLAGQILKNLKICYLL